MTLVAIASIIAGGFVITFAVWQRYLSYMTTRQLIGNAIYWTFSGIGSFIMLMILWAKLISTDPWYATHSHVLFQSGVFAGWMFGISYLGKRIANKYNPPALPEEND